MKTRDFLLHIGGGCGIILRHECRILCDSAVRHALMREVATFQGREFPRSMSDFKPGEKVCTVT